MEAGLEEQRRWRTVLNWTAAILISLVFLVAGIWKASDPGAAAVRLAQAKVPESLSVAAAIGLGIAETFAGVLLLVPQFRRWGAWLGGFLLIAFMAYIGFFYKELQGAECSCFPWVKRAVGPGFFIGDAIMLAVAALAGWGARRSSGFRPALIVLGAVMVFAFVSFWRRGGEAHRHKSSLEHHGPGWKADFTRRRQGADLLFRSGLYALRGSWPETGESTLGRHPRGGSSSANSSICKCFHD